MLIDSRRHPPPPEVTADLCIVGAGPAGMTLATEMAGVGARVCLLESGGVEDDTATETALNQGIVVDPPGAESPGFAEDRHRRLGGSSHCWDSVLSRGMHARLVRPAALDFEAREGLPLTGWPFGLDQLTPYLRRAHGLFEAGPFSYEPTRWSLPLAPFPRDRKRMSLRGSRFAPATVFTRDLPTRLAANSCVDVILHATATRLETDNRGTRVTAIRAAGAGAHSFAVRAGVFVLAAGGLENARLLLLSGRGQPAAFGNSTGLVGRCFMDHPNVVLGTLVPTRLALGAWAAYDLQYVDGFPVRADLVLGESVLRRERLPHAALYLAPRPRWRDSPAVRATAELALSLRRRRRPARGFAVLRDLLVDPEELIAAAWYRGVRRPPPLWEAPWGWSRVPQYARAFHGFKVRAHVEQLPDRSSRVTLADDLDALGLPRLRVEWRLSDYDLRSTARLAQIVASEVERSGVGSFILAVDPSGETYPPFMTSHHHLGTTRMHDNPNAGVVDAHCRVHGITNLYLAGASVFPTGAGYANPTLIIVALALRLAERLQRELGT